MKKFSTILLVSFWANASVNPCMEKANQAYDQRKSKFIRSRKIKYEDQLGRALAIEVGAFLQRLETISKELSEQKGVCTINDIEIPQGNCEESPCATDSENEEFRSLFEGIVYNPFSWEYSSSFIMEKPGSLSGIFSEKSSLEGKSLIQCSFERKFSIQLQKKFKNKIVTVGSVKFVCTDLVSAEVSNKDQRELACNRGKIFKTSCRFHEIEFKK